MTKPQGLGGKGEDIAEKYLVDNGFEILERNFHSRFGEIDIIAKDGKYLCFIEVKTRNGEKNLATGFESITVSKQRKIIKTAEYFLATNRELIEYHYLQPRFDCVEVNLSNDSLDVDLIKNAF